MIFSLDRLRLSRLGVAGSRIFLFAILGWGLGCGWEQLLAAPSQPVPSPDAGKLVVAGADGALVLQASTALVRGKILRFEPEPHKNCLGYWTDPADWAEWNVQIATPGEYDIEVWQGCGRGQGGSLARIESAGRSIEFVVQETGHFQIFAPRPLGRVRYENAGQVSLAVKPANRKANAVMDIRQIRLLPVRHGQPATIPLFEILSARRVAFLGDSITHAGGYAAYVEAWIRLNHPTNQTIFLNLGLPSETVSGLSEPGHAGGHFPRPDLHERLGRIFEHAKPDLVIACYGMNDGIYHPPADERFAKFKSGVERLRESAARGGAQVIHLTPPVFDPVPLKGRTLPAGLTEYRQPYEGYNLALDQFSQWLMGKKAEGFVVIDAHMPMNDFLASARIKDPAFLLAGDGVHLNSQGHWLVAREILRSFNAPRELISAQDPKAFAASHPNASEILELATQRQSLLRDAWLARIGHKRPGMQAGKPLAVAMAEGEALGNRMRELAAASANTGR